MVFRLIFFMSHRVFLTKNKFNLLRFGGQAKKREKKKNAAKELAVEPPSKESKAGGDGGRGGKNASPGVSKRSNGKKKTGGNDGNTPDSRNPVQSSQDLGKKVCVRARVCLYRAVVSSCVSAFSS